MECLQQNYDNLRDDCKKAVQNFTEMESEVSFEVLNRNLLLLCSRKKGWQDIPIYLYTNAQMAAWCRS